MSFQVYIRGSMILIYVISRYQFLSTLQLQGVDRRLDLLRICQPSLSPGFIHDFHDHDTLLPRQPLALELAVTHAARRLICLPVHTLPVTGELKFDLLDGRSVLSWLLAWDQAIPLGSECGSVNLDLTLCSLDADRGAGGVLFVRVGRDAEMRHGDSLGLEVGLVGWGGRREGEEDGSRLIGAGEVVRC